MMGCRVFLLAAALISLPLAAAEITVTGSGNSRDLACEGKDVAISGFNHVVKLTGDCGVVAVHGHSNTVSFERATAVEVSGVESQVSGEQTGGLQVAGKQHHVQVGIAGKDAPAEIDVRGFHHKIEAALRSAATITVSGHENAVRWSLQDGAPAPQTEIHGHRQTVEQVQ